MADEPLGVSELRCLTCKWERMTPPYWPPGFVVLRGGRRRPRLWFCVLDREVALFLRFGARLPTTHSGGSQNEAQRPKAVLAHRGAGRARVPEQTGGPEPRRRERKAS